MKTRLSCIYGLYDPNATDGGEGVRGLKMSLESRLKMSKSAIRNRGKPKAESSNDPICPNCNTHKKLLEPNGYCQKCNLQKELYTCSGCNQVLERKKFHEWNNRRSREVTSQCRSCRKETRYSKIYSTLCAQCRKPRKLNNNGVCKHCNAEAGLKQCPKCQLLLALWIDFRGDGKGSCKLCLTQ